LFLLEHFTLPQFQMSPLLLGFVPFGTFSASAILTYGASEESISSICLRLLFARPSAVQY
jgi:hypothetical protein